MVWNLEKQLKTVFLGLGVLTIALASLPVVKTYAAQSDSVGATVRISVCGDGVVEYPEECEILQDVVKSCTDFGFSSGSVRCDNSCEFDVLNCFTTTVPNLRPGAGFTPFSTSSLPSFLIPFDINGDDVIKDQEFLTLITKWVAGWKIFIFDYTPSTATSCDLDGNRVCDLVDLSILLYYSK
ncbi:MAG: hypothetical protein UT34_C0001G0023 [candidate division WS6 bacterium GW2011_GWF2_39_15]|uniref:Dockerin domain-containing protein n=1 Tax=candidate division WS6 bacterium GW2011_GWF2_39_15 TaxID=1619100 RepID=A0A0G0MS27_9BACT|nr:MAG: hypothetical protein UT34_C0001G0023 [candidate division WS6 bacterium GW2011_GWF2_39_15]